MENVLAPAGFRKLLTSTIELVNRANHSAFMLRTAGIQL
jgi:hypothetical protein